MSKSKKESFNVAIVGYGLAGATFHAPLIKATTGLKVSAIVARSPEKQAKVSQDFPQAEIFPDFEKLLTKAKANEKTNDIDLVVIATPNKDHAPQAVACLEAGIAVVIDKPAAINSSECQELINCSKRHGSLLTVFQNRRWDNDFLTLKKLLAEGRLGKIFRFESRFERYRPAPRAGAWREMLAADEGGGILFDLGSHLIDQATVLFGQPDQVYAEMEVRRAGVMSDDDSFVALSFPNGVKAHIWTNAVASSQGHRFRLLGSTAAYEKYGLDPQEDALRSGKTPLDQAWGIEAPEYWGNLTEYHNGDKSQTKVETVAGSYQHFYEIMREALAGNGDVPVDPHDALNCLRIIELARKSAEKQTSLSMSHS